MVKCLPEFEYFTVFLKNRNFISKIRRSKVTDYAASNNIRLDCDVKYSLYLLVSLADYQKPLRAVLIQTLKQRCFHADLISTGASSTLIRRCFNPACPLGCILGSLY